MTDEDEYRVYFVKLPGSVRGASRLGEDGFASIYINDQLSPKAKKAAFRHEMLHLRRGDHDNGLTIFEAEGAVECQGRNSSSSSAGRTEDIA